MPQAKTNVSKAKNTSQKSKAQIKNPSKGQSSKASSGSQVSWYPQAKVSCVCGNSFVTGSTLPEIKLDICNVCHPFYTGKQKFVDVEGRLNRFQKRYAKFHEQKASKASVKPKNPPSS